MGSAVVEVLLRPYSGFWSCNFFRVFVDKVALNLILLFIVVGIHRVVNDGSNGSALNR